MRIFTTSTTLYYTILPPLRYYTILPPLRYYTTDILTFHLLQYKASKHRLETEMKHLLAPLYTLQ